jgi:RNA polymerase sigma factor (TIGR02999 family)
VPHDDDITEMLLAATSGSSDASNRLYPLIYDDLRRMARRQLSRERPDHTLRPTELVHETYLRLFDQTRCEWKDRSHFLGVACRAMRQILVEHARHRGRQKRGGGLRPVSLDRALEIGSEDFDTTLLALDLALDKLAKAHPEKAQIVEMHFFGGLTHQECADVLGVSARTVARYWEFAQAWLSRELTA